MLIKRGDIILADLEPVRGSEQGGIRPSLVIQNDISNKYSPIIIIAAITSRNFKKEYPTNIFLNKEDSGLDKNSTIMLNQIRTIDKKRVIRKISFLNDFIMKKVDMAIKISLGIR
jgi:mRNA interferase MazF